MKTIGWMGVVLALLCADTAAAFWVDSVRLAWSADTGYRIELEGTWHGYCGGDVPYAPPVAVVYPSNAVELRVGDPDEGLCFSVLVPFASSVALAPPDDAYEVRVYDASGTELKALLQTIVPRTAVIFADGLE